MAQEIMRTLMVMNAVTVAASGSYTSHTINLEDYKAKGFFSLYIALTGDGTGKFEYELSADGSTFLTPSSATDIVTAHLKTSGPGSDGKDLYSFSPEVAKDMKIKVTETGTSNSITITAYLTVQ